MIVVPFKAFHLVGMTLQPQQEPMRAKFKIEDLRTLETVPSYSCFEGDDCVACAGVVPYWEGRYQAWAFLSQQARSSKRVMVDVTRAVVSFLNLLNARRVELAVAYGYDDGHKWAKHLGFSMETPLARGYDVDGGDAAIYVRLA